MKILIGFLFTGVTAFAQWGVHFDSGAIRIESGALGDVVSDAHFQANGRFVKGWDVRESTPTRLVLRSASPKGGWRIEANGDTLVISTNVDGAVLTGQVPVNKKRGVARLLDPEGTPVIWSGTGEVKGTYGGNLTENPSFLPRRNADVLYLALGTVSGSQFHAIFDQRTDTAVDFGSAAQLQASRNALELLLPVNGNATLRLHPKYFVDELHVPFYEEFDDRVFTHAPMVWSSWTSYYEAVTEQDIVKNADWLGTNLKPYGFEYVQLDDGYDRGPNGEHSWIENWDKEKFPHGPEWLTNYIRSKGLKAGIWLVPNSYAAALKEHPDWYVYDKNGKVVLDYATPALDSTNPHALDTVHRIFAQLDDWGFDYYKLDGEHALPLYDPNADRFRLHDPNVDLLFNYRKRVELIRNTIGPNRFIEGCPAGTPLNAIGYFNSYFNGHDLYNTWNGMYALFSSINANLFLNHIVVYVMPGEGLELGLPMSYEEAAKKRPKIVLDTAKTREDPLTQFGLTDAEARTLVTYVSLTGVAYPLASVMPEVPPQRLALLKATMPTLPITPIDLFSRGTDMQWDTFKTQTTDSYIHNYPEILDLKVNASGEPYDVVAITNWTSATAKKSVALDEKFGLPVNAAYVGLDFWNQKPVRVNGGRLNLDLDPHDTRVVSLRRLLDRPQVIGNSRHISGTYSMSGENWDGSAMQLSGVVESVAGDPYALWVNVPGRFAVEKAAAKSTSGKEIAVRISNADSAVKLEFDGQPQPVSWTIRFRKL